MIDTHCHLNYTPLEDDLEEVINRAEVAGVDGIIVPGTSVEASISAVDISKNFPSVYAAVGIHPEELMDDELDLDDIFEIEKMVLGPKVVAIGEVGLDYYYLHDYSIAEREAKVVEQKALFARMLKMAKEHSLPVIVHSREASEDVWSLVSTSGVGRAVMHCFVGSWVEVKRWLDYGGYISLTGIITYKKNSELREVVSKIPIERIMLETDAPFLPPEGYRGLPCEPAYVRKTAECLAEIKGLSVDEVDLITTNNAQTFFDIK